MAGHHEGARDAHMDAHAHHIALADHYEKADKEAARQHHGIAGAHLKLAEHHHNIAEALRGLSASPADQAAAAPKPPAPPQRAFGGGKGDHLAIGAANQLHRKGHIDGQTRDRIHREAKRKPFGSLAGAGHYMGDVDTANGPGTM